ncbi:MAG: TIGR03986 family CRISPR-associated RAMP protein [Thermodesulfovibrionales bacterium]
MERARLSVYKSSKGSWIINVIFSKNRQISIPEINHPKPESLNGIEVYVEHDKGQIVKIMHQGKTLFQRKGSIDTIKNQKKIAPSSKKGQQQKTQQPIPSQAPYNFIPINEIVVPAEPMPEGFNRYHNNYYTGYIDLEIKALTPLYIRDTLTKDEYRKKLEHEKQNKKEPFPHPDFFSPGDLVRIPGSSLRGMIRTLVEIVSYGRFEFFDDKRLYFRFMADRKKELRQYYRERIGTAKAGVLKKEGYRKFCIIETEAEQKEDISRTDEIVKTKDGWIIYTGKMGNKLHNWFIKKPDEQKAKRLELDYNRVIKSYLNDSTRGSNINLIDLLKKEEFKDGVPCFYCVDSNGNVTAIGHTKYMRIPYEHTIKDSVKQRSTDLFDIPNAIFGNEKSHASRVFFEDAFAEKYETEDAPSYPKILSSPKPTCIQHYLEQQKYELQHYDSPSSTIRGYKLYWHRDGKNWQETNQENIEKHKSQYTSITPIKEGAIFKGRIRFENLSAVELGALLFVLDLPEGCAHKIGMGKPLGLGSIRIRPTLYLSNRKERYTNLLSEWTEPLKEAKEKIKEFKDAFERYILKNINENNKTSLWELDRLKDLKIMLDFAKKPPQEETEYLALEKFRERRILPSPTQIIQNKYDGTSR